MERVELRVDTRTMRGKKVKRLRAESLIPAVVYGPDMDAAPIQIGERSLFIALQQAGSTALIDLFIDDKTPPHVVLAREIQRDPLTSRVQHVDFYTVRLTEKVKTMPRIEFVGSSPLAEGGRGVVVTNMTEVEVECLPQNLPEYIEVDIAGLQLNDSLHLSDLKVPEGVTLVELARGADHDLSVVSIHTRRGGGEEEEGAVPAAEGGPSTEGSSS